MKELLEALARGLVEEQDRVRVSEHARADLVRLELRVAAGDRGRVIGKRGRTADALRTLLGAVARGRGQALELEILA